MSRADKISITQKMPEYYSDFEINMSKNAITGQLARLTNADAVKQSLVGLVLTDPKERPYQPWLGSLIRRSLFDNIDDELTIDKIKDSIIECVKNNETRANILRINVEPDTEKNGYNVEVIFSIINLTIPQTARFFLERVR
jgi:phage baseplate assembly protein W